MRQQPNHEAPVKDIESPNGLDLRPAPPDAVRLSKRAGIAALLTVTAVVALVGYGVVTRCDRTMRLADPADNRGLTAATEAGKVVAAAVPTRILAMDEKLPKEEASREGRDQGELTPPQLRRTELGHSTGLAPRNQAESYGPPPAPARREPTPEQRQYLLLLQQEVEARSAPTSTRGDSGGRHSSQSTLPTAGGDVAQMTELLQAMKGPVGRTSSGAVAGGSMLSAIGQTGSSEGGTDGFADQNMQEQKEAFLLKARATGSADYLKSTRAKPLSPYEIKAGWDIPAILEQALNSDLPGEVRALVRENVFDTATGAHLLIPQGSRLVGVYDSKVAYGQSGILVVWNRVIYPDGSAVNLEGMAGQDARGQSGFRHEVDRHYARLIGFAALTSGFGAAFQLSQSRRDNNVLSYPSPAEIAGSSVGRELSQIGAQTMRRNLNVQPTIKVPIGYRFNVRVNKDILFEGPYTPNRM